MNKHPWETGIPVRPRAVLKIAFFFIVTFFTLAALFTLVLFLIYPVLYHTSQYFKSGLIKLTILFMFSVLLYVITAVAATGYVQTRRVIPTISLGAALAVLERIMMCMISDKLAGFLISGIKDEKMCQAITEAMTMFYDPVYLAAGLFSIILFYTVYQRIMENDGLQKDEASEACRHARDS
jgi:hypothetical protein